MRLQHGYFESLIARTSMRQLYACSDHAWIHSISSASTIHALSTRTSRRLGARRMAR